MSDTISKKHRSWNMSRIGSKNTKPELIVRSILHRMGYRFRLNGKISTGIFPKGFLPGKPDIVLSGHRAVIFVNGCFWHMHKGCNDSTIPKTRTEWWLKKLNTNVNRDLFNIRLLKEENWKVLIIWECELKKTLIPDLEKKLLKFLSA